MTDKVTIHVDTFGNENVIIDRGNGEYTSMPKAVYDAQVEHLTKNVPANE
jgi:hypothetical protein